MKNLFLLVFPISLALSASCTHISSVSESRDSKFSSQVLRSEGVGCYERSGEYFVPAKDLVSAKRNSLKCLFSSGEDVPTGDIDWTKMTYFKRNGYAVWKKSDVASILSQIVKGNRAKNRKKSSKSVEIGDCLLKVGGKKHGLVYKVTAKDTEHFWIGYFGTSSNGKAIFWDNREKILKSTILDSSRFVISECIKTENRFSPDEYLNN